MLQTLFDWLHWKMAHRHDWEDKGYATQLGSREQWYWRNEECRWCPKRRTILTPTNYWRRDDD